jgi:hypothetical protein
VIQVSKDLLEFKGLKVIQVSKDLLGFKGLKVIQVFKAYRESKA